VSSRDRRQNRFGTPVTADRSSPRLKAFSMRSATPAKLGLPIWEAEHLDCRASPCSAMCAEPSLRLIGDAPLALRPSRVVRGVGDVSPAVSLRQADGGSTDRERCLQRNAECWRRWERSGPANRDRQGRQT
jgi:hypothetical protein